ncbi:MAG: hypothetical protein HY899_04875 [Deltaproteobacteria bacterium]|nr:hypothetical protein [Deltaproteobacteria bacterium]
MGLPGERLEMIHQRAVGPATLLAQYHRRRSHAPLLAAEVRIRGARIQEHRSRAHDPPAGAVLVCPFTDPAWTPLFALASAVVADTGGPLSHAAIVAREYGIPAVLGVQNGTLELRDGDLVHVDGRAGTVERR